MNQNPTYYSITLKIRYQDNSLGVRTIPIFSSIYDVGLIEEALSSQLVVSLEEVKIFLGSRLYELYEKKELENLQLKALTIIQDFFEFLSAKNRIDEINTLEFINQNAQLDVTDQVFEWLEKLQFKSTKALNVECNYISEEQFIKLYDIVSQKMVSLTDLKMNFVYRGTGLQKEKLMKGENHPLKNIYYMRIYAHEQLDLLRFFPELEHVYISFAQSAEIKIEQVINQVNLLSPNIVSLSLQFSATAPFKTGCIKGIEKLSQLNELALVIPRVLPIKELDINCMKQVEKFKLNCQDPKIYLSEIKSDHPIKNIKIDNNKKPQSNQKPLAISKFNNIEALFWTFYANKKSDLAALKSDLQEIAKAAHKLIDLTLDFTKCSYFKQNEMEEEIINLIGDIFEKCTEQTRISLGIDESRLKTTNKLDIALQFLKIQNVEQFQLNNRNLLELLENQSDEDGKTIYLNSTVQYYLPYFYGILPNLPQYQQVTVPLLISSSLPYNLQIDNPYRYFFTNFTKFIISNYGYSQNDENFYIEYLKKIIPEDAKYIDIRFDISLSEIGQIKDHFTFMNTLSCTLSFHPTADISQLKSQRKSIQLDIIVGDEFFSDDNILKYFLHEQDLININLEIMALDELSQITKLFNLINQENQRILITIHQYEENDYQSSVQKLNEYSKVITSEKQKISAFDQLIKLQLPINPYMVYSDLYLE